jgi:hypothetical protein
MDHGACWVPRFAINCQGEWGLCVVCECAYVLCVVCCVLCVVCCVWVAFWLQLLINNHRAAMVNNVQCGNSEFRMSGLLWPLWITLDQPRAVCVRYPVVWRFHFGNWDVGVITHETREANKRPHLKRFLNCTVPMGPWHVHGAFTAHTKQQQSPLCFMRHGHGNGHGHGKATGHLTGLACAMWLGCSVVTQVGA